MKELAKPGSESTTELELEFVMKEGFQVGVGACNVGLDILDDINEVLNALGNVDGNSMVLRTSC